MRLDGKTVMITGGGRGIGRAMALRFAAEGAQLAITDLDEEAADAVAGEVADAGGDAVAIVADAASTEDGQRAVDTTVERFGKLDVLVNNAGLPSQYAEGTEHEQWDRGIEVTLSSAYRQSVAALPNLTAPGGCILNVCSIAGNKIGTAVPWYDAAKAGVSGLTRHLAALHGPSGIRVNAVCYGLIETRRTSFITDVEEVRDQWLATTPLRRFGQPDEAAAAALFLVSDDASLVTGHMLIADAGTTIV